MVKRITPDALTFDYTSASIGESRLIHADCFEWLGRVPENSLHAIVTDPPYGVKEYDFDQLEKRANGNEDIWRIPPSFDGHTRAPLARFTALDAAERKRVRRFFVEWARGRRSCPAPPVAMSLSPVMHSLHKWSMTRWLKGGCEFRGQIIRTVRTLRGGDRPKNAEKEFPGVSSMPRGCYEPWGLLRKPIPEKMRLSDCLREFKTGVVKRRSIGRKTIQRYHR